MSSFLLCEHQSNKISNMHYLDLYCSAYVFNSDDDLPFVADLTVGYDLASNDLIILLAYTDYEEPEYNCATWAIVKKDDAFKLARRKRGISPVRPGKMAFTGQT